MVQRDRSAATARTRRAILEAAASVLATNPGASVEAIALAADMARSTVHRHFPERADLEAALETLAEERLAEAARAARTGEGTGRDALLRLCTEYHDLGELVLVAYAGSTVRTELEAMHDVDPGFAALIERGFADGSIDDALTVNWIQQMLWSLLYAAWLSAKAGVIGRREALALCLRSLENLLTAAKR